MASEGRDIVERLEGWSADIKRATSMMEQQEGEWVVPALDFLAAQNASAALMSEAAAEIRRLRAEAKNVDEQIEARIDSEVEARLRASSGREEKLREAVKTALGEVDFSPGLDALAGAVRYKEIEDGRWRDLNTFYGQLVDVRRRALADTEGESDA